MRRMLTLCGLMPWLCLTGCFDPSNAAATSSSDGTTGGASDRTSGSPAGDSSNSLTSSPGPSSGAGTTSLPPVTQGTQSEAGTSTDGSSDPTATAAGTDSGESTETTDSDDASGPDPTTDSGACVQDCSGIACGEDPVCSLDCPMQCGAAAECADDQSYCGVALGNPDFLGTDADIIGDVIFGHRVSIAANTTLKALGVIAGGGGPNVQLALYSDSAGPQTRLRQTGEFALVNDDNRIDVADTPLVAGDYWVMMHAEGLTSLGRSADDDNDHEFAYTFLAYPGDGSDSFPLSIDDDTIVEDYRYNLYIVVEE